MRAAPDAPAGAAAAVPATSTAGPEAQRDEGATGAVEQGTGHGATPGQASLSAASSFLMAAVGRLVGPVRLHEVLVVVTSLDTVAISGVSELCSLCSGRIWLSA